MNVIYITLAWWLTANTQYGGEFVIMVLAAKIIWGLLTISCMLARTAHDRR